MEDLEKTGMDYKPIFTKLKELLKKVTIVEIIQKWRKCKNGYQSLLVWLPCKIFCMGQR